MKHNLAMGLFSRRSLTASLAREQITALSDFSGGLMRPDKCSEFEPIRIRFDPADISNAIQWLAKPHGEFFYRKGSPAQVSGEMWNLTHSPSARFPSPLFSNRWTGAFDHKWAERIGIEKVEDFVFEMFRVTGSDFGLLTPEVDLKSKNRTTAAQGQIHSLSYKGLDPALGIPGLYWVSVFSEELAAWLRLSELPKNLGMMKTLAGGGVVIKFGESPDRCRSPEILQQQRVAIEWLGPQKFFDIRFPDRQLDAPNWHLTPPGIQKSIG
jgi:hypothetical protein